MKNDITLVDKFDKQIGRGEKMEVHRKGQLHRAFSIFVFNKNDEMLLQKRASGKYHSGGLWSNTCCSHPGPEDQVEEAAHRRLREEMGFDCDLEEQFSFMYQASLGDLSENELDHVFFGQYEDDPVPAPDEVEDWKWISINELKKDVQEHPDLYTYWFKIALERIFTTTS